MLIKSKSWKLDLSRITISSLPDELLVEIFDWCRLGDEYGWNYRRRWYKPLQVCRRWRYLMLGSASRLKLRLLCSCRVHRSLVVKMLMHSPPLPLIIGHPPGTSPPPQHQENVLLALPHSDRVCSISIREWESMARGLKLLQALDKPFPMLENLSLSSHGYTSRILPHNFVAPNLHTLRLDNVAISVVSLFLTNVANLISLHLNYFPLDRSFSASLVELISTMPRLETLSIKVFSYLLDEETGLDHTQITRVVLPSLRSLRYVGYRPYLETLLAKIGTPLLHHFSVELFWQRTSTPPRLSEFLATIPNHDLRMAEVSFHPTTVSIAYHPGQPSASLPYFAFHITQVFDLSEQVTSVTQICSAIGPVFPIVQGLALENKEDQRFPASTLLWKTFLRSFGGVKMLRVDRVLAGELSCFLHAYNEPAIKELLPMLSELVVVSMRDQVHNPLASFLDARRLAGHPIDFRISRQHPPPHPLFTPWCLSESNE